MKRITTQITTLVAGAAALAPSLALAVTVPAPPVGGTGITGSGLIAIINTVVQMLMTVSVVIGVGAFVYGAIKYFALGDDKGGKEMMKRAVIGIALILGIGLILNTIAGLINRGLNVG
jgi:hypothetical protein